MTNPDLGLSSAWDPTVYNRDMILSYATPLGSRFNAGVSYATSMYLYEYPFQYQFDGVPRSSKTSRTRASVRTKDGCGLAPRRR